MELENFLIRYQINELEKILEETNFANDLNLHLRINISNNFAKIDLSEKFGVRWK